MNNWEIIDSKYGNDFVEDILNKIICDDVIDGIKIIPDNSVHVIITSPPYNIGMEYTNHNDNMDFSDYFNWLYEIWIESKRVLIKGGRICIIIGESNTGKMRLPTFSVFINQLLDLGFLYRGIIVWNKNQTRVVTSWGSWMSCSDPYVVPRHEYIIVFSKEDMRLEGDKNRCDLKKEEFLLYTNPIWNISPGKSYDHPASFPLEIAKRLIKLYSFKDNIVLDMFSGTGTVGVACFLLSRNFILIDNSLDYCKIALKRIKNEYKGKRLF